MRRFREHGIEGLRGVRRPGRNLRIGNEVKDAIIAENDEGQRCVRLYRAKALAGQ